MVLSVVVELKQYILQPRYLSGAQPAVLVHCDIRL